MRPTLSPARLAISALSCWRTAVSRACCSPLSSMSGVRMLSDRSTAINRSRLPSYWMTGSSHNWGRQRAKMRVHQSRAARQSGNPAWGRSSANPGCARNPRLCGGKPKRTSRGSANASANQGQARIMAACARLRAPSEEGVATRVRVPSDDRPAAAAGTARGLGSGCHRASCSIDGQTG